MDTKISIILPAYNEEKAIGGVIDNLITTMNGNGYDFEIIVVDDASTDYTAEIARKRNVRLLQHTINKGTGSARKTGILNAQGNTIVMLDADGTYPVDKIPAMLKFIPDYDQVIGVRRIEYGKLKFIRLFVKKFIFSLASLLAKKEIPDLNSGLRIIKKNIIMKYLYLIPDSFSCVSTMTLAFLYNGHNIKWVPIEYHKRIGKSKFNIFHDTLVILLTIIRMKLRFRHSQIHTEINR